MYLKIAIIIHTHFYLN